MNRLFNAALIVTISFLGAFSQAQSNSTTVVLPAGVKVEKYKYNFIPNNDPTKLSICGVYSSLKSDSILQDMSLESESGPFYQYLRTNRDISLQLTGQSFKQQQGTDCNYKGFGGEDPDWNCSDKVSGYWARIVLNFSDIYGNSWVTYTNTALVSDASQVPSEAQAKAKLLSDLNKSLLYCK